ncbi:MAG: hypothetical protein DYG83_17975 [Candidatus Brocadia sp. AMX2]|uniref:Uncharacterized conserved protein n=1 Tax=Candidatus Brocadia sinica JPN1 TaxID=1197129 RepID=A0ABQ0JYN7_9BACT|nr:MULTISPECIES: SAM-dependent chlorinase/fluorinase [Brocadia]MBC6934110.1 hypothetical protein [Candidatus Brocadia sp.]MBL1170697.1 hypothetical protein [Candidatus Brocadia sp. AMX1]NOG40409.1 SAM-dependent chlorinase/fluorinase [Planctomycetota bacterium]GIK14885.1 MAG: hypothetical protein BroJett002_35920 [Candidatus Brocadia sinica]KAA0241270.1 MAG: hypothetical protein EDM70_18460 [Candidatus Brocadia sp. AMX2]
MRRSHIITLLTDFGNQDAYVGIMKGVIGGINPSANIIDICHTIPPYDLLNGAYLLSASYQYFPKGTIHVAVVDPGVGSRRDIICVAIRDYLFLVPNNGILSFIVPEEKPKNIIRVTNTKFFLPSPGNTFHGRDIFAPVAAHLSLGIKPQQLDAKINQLEHLDLPQPEQKKTGQMEGRVIYIDRFGNLITNITQSHIEQHIINQSQSITCRDKITSPILHSRKKAMKGKHAKQSFLFHLLFGEKETARKYVIETTLGKKKIMGLSKTYMDVKPGEPLVLFGSTDFLEISINQGNAQKYFKVDQGGKVLIRCNSGFN